MNIIYFLFLEYQVYAGIHGRIIPISHQLLSAILLRWVFQYEDEFHIMALADVRTQIIGRARYRLPDVMVFTTPMPVTKVMTRVPNAVIEILSPGDRDSEMPDRFFDYSALGVDHLILMDPERHLAWRHDSGLLLETNFSSLLLPGRGELPSDTAVIFEQLRRKLAQIEGIA